MLIVHAGNRIDAPGRATKRFPAEHEADVRTRVGRLLTALAPDGVVSAPAAGADVIVLQEADSRGIPIHVVVPLDVDAFEAASVADQGPRWVDAYRRVIARARTAPNTLVEHHMTAESEWYKPANAVILGRAAAVAGSLGALVAALVVRPPSAEGTGSVTDDFVTRARVDGTPVIGIDPSRGLHELPRVLVVLASGTELDPTTGQPIDGDSIVHKLVIPALENADLDWERSGPHADGGPIPTDAADAADELSHADLVITDLDGFRQLGPGHTAADKATILMARADGSPPPAIAPVGYVAYEMAACTLSDHEAVAGWATLGRVIASVQASRPRPS